MKETVREDKCLQQHMHNRDRRFHVIEAHDTIIEEAQVVITSYESMLSFNVLNKK